MAGRTSMFAGFGCAGLSVLFVIAIWQGAHVAAPDAVPAPQPAPPIAAPAPPPALPPPAPVVVQDEPRDWLYVHGEVDVRAEPDRNAPVVATLRRGSRVQLGAPDAAGWSRLYAQDVPDGYVYRASALLSAHAPSEEDEEPLVYRRGPRGGCYYVVEPSGDKRYVDRSRCE